MIKVLWKSPFKIRFMKKKVPRVGLEPTKVLSSLGCIEFAPIFLIFKLMRFSDVRISQLYPGNSKFLLLPRVVKFYNVFQTFNEIPEQELGQPTSSNCLLKSWYKKYLVRLEGNRRVILHGIYIYIFFHSQTIPTYWDLCITYQYHR